MSTGIYKITNLTNSKSYIGQSVNIEERWKRHKIAKDNFPIHQALRKYPIECFEFTILEECSKEQLNDKEQFWIKYYNTYNSGYNCTLGGDTLAVVHEKPVKQFDLNGKFIREYQSERLAGELTGIDPRYISNCCLNKNNSAKGYQWCFVGEEDNIINNSKNYGGNKKIPVNQYSLDGKYIQTFDSVNDISKILGRRCNKEIIKCCEKQLKTSQNFMWRYADEGKNNIEPYNSKKTHTTNEKKVAQYTLDGKLIKIYDNAVLAAEAVGLSKGGNSAILRVCKGKQKTSKGFLWKYIND